MKYQQPWLWMTNLCRIKKKYQTNIKVTKKQMKKENHKEWKSYVCKDCRMYILAKMYVFDFTRELQSIADEIFSLQLSDCSTNKHEPQRQPDIKVLHNVVYITWCVHYSYTICNSSFILSSYYLYRFCLFTSLVVWDK